METNKSGGVIVGYVFYAIYLSYRGSRLVDTGWSSLWDGEGHVLIDSETPQGTVSVISTKAVPPDSDRKTSFVQEAV